MTDCQNKKLWSIEVNKIIIEEDETLRKAVSIVNNDKWNEIATKFEELYLETYGIIKKRAGKQCRERWYNKLHPELTRTLESWSNEESVALLSIYQEMGPKWAKIIFKLCEAGYSRRSDNNIKNHFHLIVKKSLKDLNQFIKEYNQRVKESFFSGKVKKVYVYEKTYSIEKMIRKQLPRNNVMSVNGGDDICGEGKKNYGKDVKEGEENTGSVEEVDVKECIKGDSIVENNNINKSLALSEESIAKTNPIEPSVLSSSKQPPTTLRLIDKKSIDRFWLWSNDKSTGRLEILSSFEDTELRTVRNSFLEYMKHPESFEPEQLKELIEEVNNFTKCCKKLNKKKREKIIKSRHDKTKFYIERTAKRIFDNILIEIPEQKKLFNRNKQEILSRLVFLISNIYTKYEKFQEEEECINKNEIISRRHEVKIKKTIVEEMAGLSQREELERCSDLKEVKREEEEQKLSLLESVEKVQIVIDDDNKQPLCEADTNKKLKKIRKYKKREPSSSSTTKIKQTKIKKNTEQKEQEVVKREEVWEELNSNKEHQEHKEHKEQEHIVRLDGGELSCLVEVINNSNTNDNINFNKIKNCLMEESFCDPSTVLKKEEPYYYEQQEYQHEYEQEKHHHEYHEQEKSFFTFIEQIKEKPEYIHHNNRHHHYELSQQNQQPHLQSQERINNNNKTSSLSSSMSFSNTNTNNVNLNSNNDNKNSNINPFQEVKVEDSFWNNIKLGEESDKTTEVNNCNHHVFITSSGVGSSNHHNAYSATTTNNNPFVNNINSFNTNRSPSPSSELLKLQFTRPFEEKHIESEEQSEYSIKSSRKSIRPNRIIHREEEKMFDCDNYENVNDDHEFRFEFERNNSNTKSRKSEGGFINKSKGNVIHKSNIGQNLSQNVNNNNKGSFSEIEKRFPDTLVRSIEFGQDIQFKNNNSFNNNNGQFSPFDGDMVFKGHSQNTNINMINNSKQGFSFYQQHPHQPSEPSTPIPFQPIPHQTTDPFRILTSSQEFLLNNSLFNPKSNPIINNQMLERSHPLLSSNDFLAMSSSLQPQQFQQQLICQHQQLSRSGGIKMVHNQVDNNNISNNDDRVYSTRHIQNSHENNNTNHNNNNNNTNNKTTTPTSGFFTNSFLQNIRNIEEQPIIDNPPLMNNTNNSTSQWKEPQIFSFENQSENNDNNPRFPFSKLNNTTTMNRENTSTFNPFISQPLDFEIPQKLIETVKNPHFPIKNYNDYSINYQHHANSLEYSKMFEFDKKFGLNSARLSEIDLFRSQERSHSHRSRSKEFEVGSNMFKSQKIHSLHDSGQFANKSRQLSNSCVYSNREYEEKLFGVNGYEFESNGSGNNISNSGGRGVNLNSNIMMQGKRFNMNNNNSNNMMKNNTINNNFNYNSNSIPHEEEYTNPFITRNNNNSSNNNINITHSNNFRL